METTTKTVAWIALAFSVFAVILGWSAFNRAGPDFLEEADQELAKAEARAELLGLRTQIAVGEAYEKSQQEVIEIRRDLERAYEDAEAQAYEEWMEIDTELELLENNLRDESADALNSLENVISLLEADVRTSE